MYNYVTNVNIRTANNNRKVLQCLLSTSKNWTTTQTNVLFVAYYGQVLNKEMTKPSFLVAYYGQPWNKWTNEANIIFFVAYRWQPQNKLMSIPTIMLLATQSVIY